MQQSVTSQDVASKISHSPVGSPEPGHMKRRKCLIVIGGMYNMFTAIGIVFSINTLYVELLDVFQTSRKETSFVQTTLVGFTFASGLIAGIIVRRIGIKISLLTGAVMSSMGFFLSWFATSIPYLIATLGILSGLGNGLVNITTVVFVATTFTEKRSFPLSLIMVGSGLGQILLPLLLERLLETYGWRGSLLITSGLVLNIIVPCLLTTSSLGADIPFRLPKKEDAGSESSKKGRWQDLLSVTFMVHVLTAALALASLANIAVLFMDFLDSQGQTLKTSVNIFVGYSVMGLLARLIAGAFSACKRIRSQLLFWSFSILAGSSLFVLKVSSSFISTVVLLYLNGAGAGGMIGLVNTVPIDLVGVDNAAIATGICEMSIGILFPVMGVLFGWIFDTTRSYSLAFDICAYIAIGSALINVAVFGVQIFMKKRRTGTQQEEGVKTSC